LVSSSFYALLILQVFPRGDPHEKREYKQIRIPRIQGPGLPTPAPPPDTGENAPRQGRLTPLSSLYCLDYIILPEKNNVKDAPVEKTAVLLVFITTNLHICCTFFSELVEIPGVFLPFSR
jgi:hypothetical protein